VTKSNLKAFCDLQTYRKVLYSTCCSKESIFYLYGIQGKGWMAEEKKGKAGVKRIRKQKT
jgi:hypothetical protein